MHMQFTSLIVQRPFVVFLFQVTDHSLQCKKTVNISLGAVICYLCLKVALVGEQDAQMLSA